MFKNKIISVIIIIIMSLAIILIAIGTIKIIGVNKELSEGLKDVEEIFGSTNDINEDNGNLNTTIENSEVDTSKAIGLITFKLKKEYKIAIYDNITEENLRKGAARATGSSKLNEIGNSVLYGHRDSAFRALWDREIGDLVEVKTKSSKMEYKVEKIYITTPDDTKIFNQDIESKDIKMTLVTCYPFIYSGPANKRCVVEMRKWGQS